MNLSALRKDKNDTPTALGPPVDDPVYRTVIALRAPGVWQATPPNTRSGRSLSIGLRVVQTHYKPYARARLVAEARVRVTAAAAETVWDKQFVYINVCASGWEAREESERTFSECSFHDFPPLLLDGGSAVVWSVTNGPGLETIGFCFDAQAVARFLADHDLASSGSHSLQLPELVRYVPRKRALFRYEAQRRAYIKCYEPDRNEQAAANLSLLARADGLGFGVPRLIAHDRRLRAVVMSEVPGIPLTASMDRVSMDRVSMDRVSPDIYAAVGRALARLHATDLKLAGSWTPERLVAALNKAMADVDLALPSLTPRLHELLERIFERGHRISFDERAPIHGNLFGDQILIDSDRVGIVDWDDLGIGDPLHDIGRLVAHLIYISRRDKTPESRVKEHLNAMMVAYEQQTERGLAWDRLRWHVAVALLMRAKISALRMLPTGWMADIVMAIGEADRILSGEDGWLPA